MNPNAATGATRQDPVNVQPIRADAAMAACDDGSLSDDVLLQICRLPAGDRQVTPEWLSRMRLVARLLGDQRLSRHTRLEAAMTLLASALGQLTQFNPTHLPFGYEGPQTRSPGWMERWTLERVGKQVVGLVWRHDSAEKVATAVECAVSESIRLGFLEQRQYDAWRPGMRSGSGWRWAVMATPYGVTRALETAKATRGQYASAPGPRAAARPEAEDTTGTMPDSECENPSDIRDVRDALRLLGVRWRTEEHLARLHTLAERSIFAARQVIGAFMLADTPEVLPKATFEVWLQHLLQTAVEIQLFPDHVPDDAGSWDALARIWDDYIAHSREFHLSGVQRITEGDPWSIRGAAKAAWNIEFASVSSPAEIGPIVADSAHRAALRFAPELWLAFSQYTNEAQDHPPNRPRLWDAFVSRWCSERVQDQCERVRACLATELAAMRDRLAVNAQAPTAAPSVAANKQYRERLLALREARGLAAAPPAAQQRSIQKVAARLADELDAWVEAISDALADRHPAGGYWTVLGDDLRDMLGPAELATGVFEDDWTPLLTQLQMSGLSELAESLDRLAADVIPQAQELARDMDAVAYLRNGGPRDAFYDLYAKDDLVTHEACVRQGRQDVARSVMRIVGMLRTLATADGGNGVAAAPMPARNPRPQPRRGTRAANIEKLEKELEKHLLAARDHAYSLRDRGREPVLLPRPSQKELARRTGLSETDVSRCINDKRATVLKILWDTADSLDAVMSYNRRR